MLSPLSDSPAPAAPDAVKDVGLSTFKADVLEASRGAVVLAAFWAIRDASNKQLVAALEKIARASKGAVRLARIDVEKNQPIAQQLGVQSVPSVFAFYKGRPVDAFAGVVSDAQAKAWVDQIVKATGATGEEKTGFDIALGQAAECLAGGDIRTAQSIYEDIVDQDASNAPAYAGIIRCLIEGGHIEKAREKLDAAPADLAKDKAFDSLRATLELIEQTRQSHGQIDVLEAKVKQDPNDHQSRFDLALACYAAQRNEDTVDHLLEIVRRARTWNEQAARKQLVKFFDAFGATDPLTIAARKRLSSLLFS